jgi:cyanobactin maturation PatA/PatG family protease
MKRVETASRPPVSLPPNPYDVNQLVDYLDGIGYSQPHKYDSTKLIWTLNLDATPIYAIETELAYAEDVYEVLRSALRNEALPTTDENYVSRVSIPGILTGKTRRLFSGQIVPVVVTQPRGLYTWNETALVNQIVQGVLQAQPETSEEFLRLTIRNFVDKIYYQLRNLGQTSSDRALNYSATNAFVFAEVVQQGLLTAQNLPGAPDHLYTLDTINVSKSPYCRMDSDCWDVEVTFFDPENDRRARSVYQYTIDVSDEMPVSLAPTHQFFIAS